jgi:cytochrome o ubiquinol oxidase subunit 3
MSNVNTDLESIINNPHTMDTHAEHHDSDATDVFGFWIYILSDCLLFATLFAGFAVLHNNTFGGVPLKELIEVPYVLGETLFLLASSFTYGLAMLALYKNSKSGALLWLIITFLCGLSFIGMEIHEFVKLAAEGHAWHTNAAMSSFFTLVGTHGLHVSFGLLWMAIMIIQFIRLGTTPAMSRRFIYLGLFWHFLDIVWIFVFTIVYLMEAI